MIGCAAGNACLIELDRVIACGDGHVDEIAGEQCDPADPPSYLAACVGTSRPFGIGACDPDTCQLIITAEQCAKCGDGIIDVEAGEQCDGSNNGVACPGSGTPSCTLCRVDYGNCDTCGNGMIDEGEECDFASSRGGGIVSPRPCAGSMSQAPLRSPYMTFPYTSGSTISCLPNCTFDRSSCGYCGNGGIDPPLRNSLYNDAVTLAEVCDGDDLDTALLADEYPACAQIGALANVACDSDCLDHVPRAGPVCCLDAGEACPQDGDSLRCCFEYAHPEVEDACLPVLDPGEGGGSGGGNAFECR